MPKPVLLCLLVPMTRSAALRVQLFGHCLLGLVPPGDCKSRRTLQGAEALHTEPGDPVRTRAGGPQGCAWCLGAPARGGFLPRHDEDLREPLVRRQGSQVSMRVARGQIYLVNP